MEFLPLFLRNVCDLHVGAGLHTHMRYHRSLLEWLTCPWLPLLFSLSLSMISSVTCIRSLKSTTRTHARAPVLSCSPAHRHVFLTCALYMCVRGSCNLEISSNHLISSQTATRECAHLTHIQYRHMTLVMTEAQPVMSWARLKADGKRGFDERSTL